MLYREQSTQLVESFEEAYDLILTSNSAYDDIPESLITELDNLINVHFEDVMTQLDDALSRLNAISSEFYLKDIALDLYADISTILTKSRDLARSESEVSIYIHSLFTRQANLKIYVYFVKNLKR